MHPASPPRNPGDSRPAALDSVVAALALEGTISEAEAAAMRGAVRAIGSAPWSRRAP